jgi:hypothetical protein
VQQGAREHHRPAHRRPIGGGAELGEAQVAALEIVVEIDRAANLRWRRAHGRVVAMRVEDGSSAAS